MIIGSQNLSNFDIKLPEDTVFRINLAWVNDLETLKEILEKHENEKIFLDLPRNRTKPPNNKYTMEEILPILESHSNIKYFAISNVDTAKILKPFREIVPDAITLVPKIESPTGVKNIQSITEILGSEKIVMLDHDDLYSSILRNNESPDTFEEYIKTLVDFCKENDVILLRTIGVLFGDSEKRITRYVK